MSRKDPSPSKEANEQKKDAWGFSGSDALADASKDALGFFVERVKDDADRASIGSAQDAKARGKYPSPLGRARAAWGTQAELKEGAGGPLGVPKLPELAKMDTEPRMDGVVPSGSPNDLMSGAVGLLKLGLGLDGDTESVVETTCDVVEVVPFFRQDSLVRQSTLVLFSPEDSKLAEFKDSSLPLDKDIDVPNDLIADFSLCGPILKETPSDVFNTLGKRIVRDEGNRVHSNKELLERINTYGYSGSLPGRVGWYFLCLVTLSGWYWKSRKTVPAGYIHRYKSSGRAMAKGPGIHVLTSVREKWLNVIPIDDPGVEQGKYLRGIGAKTQITIPQNYLGGGYRVGVRDGKEDEEEDLEFVLFGQGRHLLEGERYNNFVCKELKGDRVRIGPVTALYIKEGHIGGAYERNTGIYRLLRPGPPYLLSDKDWDDIDTAAIKPHPFRLGPVWVVSVPEGKLAGATHKQTGHYQLLPPGNMYCLHTHDWDFSPSMDVQKTSVQFKLGPYTFLTVRDGFMAGCRAVHGGDFLLLPAGHTYRICAEDYHTISMKKLDKHVVKVGPMTFLTIAPGHIAGAFHHATGRFVEFLPDRTARDIPFPSDPAQTPDTARDTRIMYCLNDDDYHHAVMIPKYSHTPQWFGPKQIITIPDGSCGVASHAHGLEILAPGFHMVSADCTIRENISLKTIQENFDHLPFNSQDSIGMTVKAAMIWRVTRPYAAAKIIHPGTFADLRHKIFTYCRKALVDHCRFYGREQLVPTGIKSLGVGVDRHAGSGEVELALYDRIQQATLEEVQAMMDDAGWGVVMLGLRVQGFAVRDKDVDQALLAMTQATLGTAMTGIQGRLNTAQVSTQAQTAMTKTMGTAAVRATDMDATIAVRKAGAEGVRREKILLSLAEAQSAAEKERIRIRQQLEEVKVLSAVATLRCDKKLEEVEVEAEVIRLGAQARYDRAMLQYQATQTRPQTADDLKKLHLAVEGLVHYGKVAWREPTAYAAYFEQIKPYLHITRGVALLPPGLRKPLEPDVRWQYGALVPVAQGRAKTNLPRLKAAAAAYWSTPVPQRRPAVRVTSADGEGEDETQPQASHELTVSRSGVVFPWKTVSIDIGPSFKPAKLFDAKPVFSKKPVFEKQQIFDTAPVFCAEPVFKKQSLFPQGPYFSSAPVFTKQALDATPYFVKLAASGGE